MFMFCNEIFLESYSLKPTVLPNFAALLCTELPLDPISTFTSHLSNIGFISYCHKAYFQLANFYGAFKIFFVIHFKRLMYVDI